MNAVPKAGSIVSGIILLSLLCSLHAADVSVYAIYKRQIYVQTNEAAPILKCCPYVFDAIVELTSSNSVFSAAVGLSNSAARPLENGFEAEFLPLRWVSLACASFPDQKALDTAWPDGDYTFSIFGATDGAITSTLNLSGNDYPAQPPHIKNFAELQSVDASRDYTLHWDAFAGGTTNDFCFVLIKKASDETPVSNTPFIGEPNALNGTVEEIVIPAGTLVPGEEYDVYVRFDKVVARNTASYPGVVGHASYACGTHVSLKTLPTSALSR